MALESSVGRPMFDLLDLIRSNDTCLGHLLVEADSSTVDDSSPRRRFNSLRAALIEAIRVSMSSLSFFT